MAGIYEWTNEFEPGSGFPYASDAKFVDSTQGRCVIDGLPPNAIVTAIDHNGDKVYFENVDGQVIISPSTVKYSPIPKPKES